jgi:hypothetical protein
MNASSTPLRKPKTPNSEKKKVKFYMLWPSKHDRYRVKTQKWVKEIYHTPQLPMWISLQHHWLLMSTEVMVLRKITRLKLDILDQKSF